jgi:hypothetical protein
MVIYRGYKTGRIYIEHYDEERCELAKILKNSQIKSYCKKHNKII